MLTDEQLATLSPLGRAFRDRFLAELGRVHHTELFTDRYELVIPAAHASVGDLRIRDDDDELTIALGEHHHWHVSLDIFDKESEASGPMVAATAAVEDLRNVLDGRTVLRITRRQGRVVRSETYDPATAKIAAPSPEESEYVWNGPLGKS